jgi:glycosyltransferase involved in cell wall biosynthesis
MTKILHITEDHSLNNTGITQAVETLVHQLSSSFEQEIITTGDEIAAIHNQCVVTCLPISKMLKVWRFSLGGQNVLANKLSISDVVHIHGIWMWIQWAAARKSLKAGIPIVLTVHGMLEPWIWNRQAWPQRLKKQIYWRSIAFPTFQSIRVAHALTRKEADHIHKLLPDATIEIIPHSLDLKTIDACQRNLSVTRVDERPYILFVGRLHPVKGVHLLIQAFSQLPKNDFIVKIAGPTQARDAKYAESLDQMVKQLGLEKRVFFLGAVQGAEKWRLYRDAWTVCQPSFSEVISLVNLEAAAACTPVITTRQSQVCENWNTEGGLFAEPDTRDITAKLKQALGWSLSERQQRGQRLRNLIESMYSWEAVTPLWISMYQRVAEY